MRCRRECLLLTNCVRRPPSKHAWEPPTQWRGLSQPPERRRLFTCGICDTTCLHKSKLRSQLGQLTVDEIRLLGGIVTEKEPSTPIWVLSVSGGGTKEKSSTRKTRVTYCCSNTVRSGGSALTVFFPVFSWPTQEWVTSNLGSG